MGRDRVLVAISRRRFVATGLSSAALVALGRTPAVASRVTGAADGRDDAIKDFVAVADTWGIPLVPADRVAWTPASESKLSAPATQRAEHAVQVLVGLHQSAGVRGA